MAKYTTTGTSSSSTSRSTVSPSNSNWDIVDKGAAASRANETQAITLRSLGPDTYCDPCGCPPPSGGGGGDGGGGQPPIVGACCIDGICSGGQTQLDCLFLGGIWQGAQTTCNTVSCEVKTGVCCLSTGTCTETTEQACANVNGIYHGDDTRCEDIDCNIPDPTGACCSSDGTCSETTQVACEQGGGVYQGDTTQCSDVNCIPEEDPTGACCLVINGSPVCASDVTEANCINQGGVYQGDDTTCGVDTCGGSDDPVGACCIDDVCSELTRIDCGIQGGEYQGDGTSCASTLCQQNPTNALFFFDNLTEHDESFPPQRLTSPTLTAPDGIGIGKSIFYTPGTYSGIPLPAVTAEWLRNGEVFDPEPPVTHVVQISNFEFSPSSITVKPGDTVTWELVNGFHGVRSGVGEDGCGDGVVFASHDVGQGSNVAGPLLDSAGNPFEWNVPDDFNSQTLEYRCTIHCGSMIGTILLEQADMSYVIQESDTGSTFRISETATNVNGVAESDSSTLTVVSDEDYPVIEEGNGFIAPTVHDEYVGDESAKGREARVIVRWTEIPFIVRDDEFYCTVSAYHMEGINRIEFILDDGTPIAVEERKPHPTDIHPASHTVNIYDGTNRYNGYHEYMVKVDPSLLSDGLHEMRCIAYPNHGKPFCLQGELNKNNLPGVEVISDGHWSFWFTVQNDREVRIVGPNEGADYSTLQELFDDNQLPNDFNTGGKVILQPDVEHEWPSQSTQGMGTPNDVSYKTYAQTFPSNPDIAGSYGQRIGTPLSVVAETGNPAFAVRIAPRYKGRGQWGNRTSIHYHGIVFTELSSHSILYTCDDEELPCGAVAAINELDFDDKSNLTGMNQGSANQGNNASLMMENCTVKADRAGAWGNHSIDITWVTGQGQRMAQNSGIGGVFYKGILSWNLSGFAGEWTPLVKNSYSVRGIADWSSTGIACVINQVLVGLQSSGSLAEPLFIHSDFYQYKQTGGQDFDTHHIDLVDITASGDRTIEFREKRRQQDPFGAGANEDPDLPEYVLGRNAGFVFDPPKDSIRFKHISQACEDQSETCTLPPGANVDAKYDIFLHCGDPSDPSDEFCDCVPVINEEALEDVSENCIYLGRLQTDIESEVYPFKGPIIRYDMPRFNRYMGKFTTFIAREVTGTDVEVSGCSTSIVGSGNDYPSAPDNRIFAAVHGWSPFLQVANISGNSTDKYKDFRFTNWAYEGWRWVSSEFQPTPDWNHWQHYNHVVFENNIITGPRVATARKNIIGILTDEAGNRSYDPDPTTDMRWKYVKWGSDQIWKRKFDRFIPNPINPPSTSENENWTPDCFIDYDTSIIEPFHVIDGGPNGANYPIQDCTAGPIKYQRNLPPVGLSKDEWEQVLVDPNAYNGIDTGSVEPRVDTYINPTLVTDSDGTHWNHLGIISAYGDSIVGERVDTLADGEVSVRGTLVGTPFFAPAQGECRCGCRRIVRPDDTQYLPWDGVEISYNSPDRPGGDGAAKETRFMCPSIDQLPVKFAVEQRSGNWSSANQPVPMNWGSCICQATTSGCDNGPCAKQSECTSCVDAAGRERCYYSQDPGGVDDICCETPAASFWCGTAENSNSVATIRLTGCGMPFYFYKWQDVDLTQPELNIVDPCKYFTNDFCPDNEEG